MMKSYLEDEPEWNYLSEEAEKIIINDEVTTIGDGAFMYFTNIKEVKFGDSIEYIGTHQKASANKNKYQDIEVEIEAKTYDEQLLKEINEQRKKINKKPFDSIEKIEKDFDEITGEEIEVRQI